MSHISFHHLPRDTIIYILSYYLNVCTIRILKQHTWFLALMKDVPHTFSRSIIFPYPRTHIGADFISNVIELHVYAVHVDRIRATYECYVIGGFLNVISRHVYVNGTTHVVYRILPRRVIPKNTKYSEAEAVNMNPILTPCLDEQFGPSCDPKYYNECVMLFNSTSSLPRYESTEENRFSGLMSIFDDIKNLEKYYTPAMMFLDGEGYKITDWVPVANIPAEALSCLDLTVNDTGPAVKK